MPLPPGRARQCKPPGNIPLRAPRLLVLALALLGVGAPWGCNRHPAPLVSPDSLDGGTDASAVAEATDSDASPLAASPEAAPGAPEMATADEQVPTAFPPANIRQIGASQLVALLKSSKDLRALTLQTAPARFAGLVPGFTEKTRDDERWELEGVNDSGFIRSIILTFGSTADDRWVFRSVSVRIHAEQPTRTFQEIRRAANAALKKPKWLDLNARDRTAWSLGGGWELVVAVLDDGAVHLHAGPSFAQ